MRIMMFGLIWLGLSSSCFSGFVTFQEGSMSYSSTQDTYLLESTPAVPWGNDQIALVIGPGSGRESHSLLRFDDIFGPGANQIAPGAVIQSATLTLSTYTASSNPIRMHDMLTAWDEATATWNSLGSGVQTDGSEGELVPTNTFFAPTANANVTLDVTSSVQAWSSGSKANLGWVFQLSGPNSSGYAFRTSNFANDPNLRPQLSVQFAAVPEPGLALPLAVAFASLFAFRRRGR